MNRKRVGYATRCFYCPETDIFCFDMDHPLTQQLDEFFKRAVCRNCHSKLERRRDIKKLTKNGQRNVIETEREAEQRYLLLMAEDEESEAELLEHSPTTPLDLLIKASKDRAASLRRRAKTLSLFDPALNPRLLDVPVVAQPSDLRPDARQGRRRRKPPSA